MVVICVVMCRNVVSNNLISITPIDIKNSNTKKSAISNKEKYNDYKEKKKNIKNKIKKKEKEIKNLESEKKSLQDKLEELIEKKDYISTKKLQTQINDTNIKIKTTEESLLYLMEQDEKNL